MGKYSNPSQMNVVKSEGYGGAFYWTVDFDANNFSTLRAIR